MMEYENVSVLESENAGNGVEMVKNGNNEIVLLPVEEIMPNRAQPRRVFDNGSLIELVESIKENGVIQPIVVREIGDLVGSVFKYELVAGERRLRAVKMAGLGKIPCVLMEVDERKSAELAIIENLHRKDLNMFETAVAISNLIDLYGVTQEEIARKLSITQSAVANKLRLLRLSDAERKVILENNLTERHARCLLRVCDEQKRWDVLEWIIQSGMNVKGAEEYVDGVLEIELVGKNEVFDEKMCVKRVNYANIIQKAIEKLRKSGCGAKSTCTETDDFYIYTITVDK